MELLSTERLRIRPWTLDPVDLAWAHRIYSDVEVVKTIGGQVMTDLSATRAHMAMRFERRAMWKEQFGAWAIERRNDGVVVGTALMKPLKGTKVKWTEDIEIGWHLARPEWGRGYATETARGLVDVAEKRGLSELHAVVEPSNTRSQQVALRAGLHPAGETTKYYDGLRLALFTRRFRRDEG